MSAMREDGWLICACCGGLTAIGAHSRCSTAKPAERIPEPAPVVLAPMRTKTIASRKRERQAILVEAIRRFRDEHGRAPTAREWAKAADDRPATHNLVYEFGSFAAAIKAAGLRARPEGSRGHRRNHHDQPFTNREEEIAWLVEQQERDWRNRFRSKAMPAYTGYVSDEWTLAVQARVDRRREIDAWAAA